MTAIARPPARARALLALLALIVLAALAGPARLGAQEAAAITGAPPLAARLTPSVLAAVYPGAERTERVADDGPVAAAVFGGGRHLGYVFSTLDVLRAPGYSSTPFDVIAGVTLEGRITGAVVLFHQEPYLLNDARRTAQLVTFLQALQGTEARLGAAGGLEPGFVAGATISARAMRNAVHEGARMVLRYRTEQIVVTKPTLDTVNFRPAGLGDLIDRGGLIRLRLTNAQAAEAMRKAGVDDFAPEISMQGGPEDLYADIVIGLGTPPMIGRNGAGAAAHAALVGGQAVSDAAPPDVTQRGPEQRGPEKRGPDQIGTDRPRAAPAGPDQQGTEPTALAAGRDAIFVASLAGVFDHRGTRFHNLSAGFALERLRIVQGGQSFAFTKPDMIPGAERGADLLVLPQGGGFDPLAPWRVDLIANMRKPDGTRLPFVLAQAEYRLPAAYVLMPEAPPPPAWLEPWQTQTTEIAILALALGVLTLILGFQHALARRRWLFRPLRHAFLAFTLVWIGWIASAQLSIVHLINYLRAPFAGLEVGFYLAEPLIVILSLYTALSLLVLGRGVFCGWLCPFGALQELLGQAARRLGLVQWNPPEALQRRLWMGKYVSLGVILLLAVVAPAASMTAQEIEPFKTAITALFRRGAPYVVYALALLAIGLFTERAFCRFLCPLGGALAILDRLHLVTLLRRRPDCGSPCQLCQRACPVRAIERSGKIVMSECFQCLDCQVEYHDQTRCPPLAMAQKARLRAAGLRPVAAPRLTSGAARG